MAHAIIVDVTPIKAATRVGGSVRFDKTPSGGVPEGNWQRSIPANKESAMIVALGFNRQFGAKCSETWFNGLCSRLSGMDVP